jgi:RimJ/RimL family protein N-acetyltransferase
MLRKDAVHAADVKGKVVEMTRVNFRFNDKLFRQYSGNAGPLPGNIVRTTAGMFDAMQGQVIPRFFWRDAAHFMRDGAGYSLTIDGKAVSTAFSAFVADGILELGIETVKEHRGKGYAEMVSRALIGHCLTNGLEPVWSCRLENTGSFNLAKKLGFEPTLQIPYYQLAMG